MRYIIGKINREEEAKKLGGHDIFKQLYNQGN